LANETGASLNVTVAGASGTEAAGVNATLTFSDFWLSAAPPLQNIVSGDSTTYTLTVTSTNGFAQAVTLACENLARDSTCTMAPASLTLDGVNPGTATVTVTTKPFSALAPPTRRWPSPSPPGGEYWIWFWGMAGLLVVSHRWLRRQRRVGVRLAAPIAALILFVMLLSSCQDYNYDLGIRPQQDTSTGTKRDNYTLIFTGTYGQVVRYASVFMSVR
jgi:VCBS repeat-containing protein